MSTSPSTPDLPNRGASSAIAANGAGYSWPAIALHWLIALLIIGMIVLGYYMINIPKGTPGRAFYFNLHKSFGVMAGVLILVRLAWRLRHRPPPLPATMPRWEVRAAQWSHRLLYLCMVLQPTVGYLSSSFNKYGVKFFGIPLPQWGWGDRFLRDLFADVHYVVGAVLATLIVIHVLAAFKHLFIDRDRVFQRMLR